MFSLLYQREKTPFDVEKERAIVRQQQEENNREKEDELRFRTHYSQRFVDDLDTNIMEKLADKEVKYRSFHSSCCVKDDYEFSSISDSQQKKKVIERHLRDWSEKNKFDYARIDTSSDCPENNFCIKVGEKRPWSLF